MNARLTPRPRAFFPLCFLLVALVSPPTTAEAQNRPGRARSGNSSHLLDFDAFAPGDPNHHWIFAGTRQSGPLATWKRTADETAPSQPNVLALTSVNHSSRSTFNVGWYDNLLLENGTIALRMKARSGKVDQGGGPIWRVKDENNYYLCRANPLEDNLRLYYVKDGSRHQLASATVKIDPGRWHTILVYHEDDQIGCFLNGQPLLEATDDTFPDAGFIGVWTKADAATSFDDILVTVQ